LINSFGDKLTEDLFHGNKNKRILRIPNNVIERTHMKLDLINAAQSLYDLKAPPSNMLEKLKGDLSGFYSIRVNDQYRIIFKWLRNNAFEVKLTDYH